MINHEFTLGYSLESGWMAPFVDALRAGQAMAMRCTACQRVTYPPVRTCSCGEMDQDWIELAATAEILYHCDGFDGQFALVRFKGAHTMSVARLEGFEPRMFLQDQVLGVLSSATGELPALIVSPAT